jgi:hypothetical protein
VAAIAIRPAAQIEPPGKRAARSPGKGNSARTLGSFSEHIVEHGLVQGQIRQYVSIGVLLRHRPAASDSVGGQHPELHNGPKKQDLLHSGCGRSGYLVVEQVGSGSMGVSRQHADRWRIKCPEWGRTRFIRIILYLTDFRKRQNGRKGTIGNRLFKNLYKTLERSLQISPSC